MSLATCIPDLLAKGQISQEQAAEMDRLFGQYRRHYAREAPAAADDLASEAALAALERQEAERLRRQLLQVKAQRQAWLAMQTYGTGAGGLRVLDPDRPENLAEAAQALLARRELAPYRNVEHLERSIRARAHATIRELLQKHQRNVLGQVRDRAGTEDILREARGQDTGNAAAKELAGAWKEASEYLRRRANAAGAAIGKIDDWGVPQAWNAQAVSDAKFDQWFADVAPHIDRSRMVDRDSGAPLGDDDFVDLMRDIFETIASDGWAKRQPGARGKGALAKRLGQERILHFKDADGWLAVAGKYGSSAGVFDAMNSHINLMARDIALMEIFGPDPASTIKWLGDAIEKAANLDGRASHRAAAFKGRQQLERLFEIASGASSRPENGALAKFAGALRAWQVATKLGSATLSTTSDQATQAIARRFNGLPIARGLATQIKLLNPANAEDRLLAMRMMLVAEEASQMAAGQARMTGEELTGEVSRRLAEATLKLSGLNAVTQAGRWAFGMDFWAAATSWRGRSFDQLDQRFRNMFLRHGLGEAHWEAIRAAPLHSERGVEWVLPENIAREGLADDIVQMVLREMDMAVPVAGLDVRAAIEGNARKGTIVGEVLRTGFQFKAFPATIMLQQYQRMMALSNGWDRAGYAVQVGIATTLMGALALQLKAISKGQDPVSMIDDQDPANTFKFWGAALAQGGGLGIFGDFLQNSTNRAGGGFTETLAGPAFATANNLASLVIGQPAAAITGENVNPGRAAIRLIKSETPVIGSLWYTRLAYERLMLDTLQEQIDPKASAAFRDRVRRVQNEGADYFWAPGTALDDARLPDVERALSN
ncbi:MAG: hypothetical protein ACK4IS_13385 [Erythrobacter sp.]